MDELRESCQSLRHQNTILSNQMESWTAQAKGSLDSGDISNTSSTDKTVSDLREVISFLRREKELLEAKYDVSRNEVSRSNQKAAILQQTVDELRLQLKAEMDRSVTKKQSEEEAAKIMSQIQENNLLRESNALLRAEHAAKNDKITELQAIVSKLEAQVNSLQAANRVLTSDKVRKEERLVYV